MSKNEHSEKVKQWFSEKRFYIMLLCCIMFLAIAYMVVYYSADTGRQAEAPNDNIVASNPPLAAYETDSPSDSPSAYVYPSSPSSSAKDSADIKTGKVPQAIESASATIDTNSASYIAPVSGAVITKSSPDTLVYSKTLGDWRVHEGVDIAAEQGSDVVSVADGKISKIYVDDLLGITIVIDHADGMESIYSNLSNATLFEEGDSVSKGQTISAVGDSAIGESLEDSHLHFEFKQNGETVNPEAYIDFE